MKILELTKYIKSKMKFINEKIERIESCTDKFKDFGNITLELSMAMFEFGIDIFDKGKNYAIDYDSFNEGLKKISKYIQNFIDEYDPFMQKSILISNLESLELEQKMLNDWKTVNVVFKDWKGQETNLTVETKITFKELFDRYMNKAYGLENSDISFAAGNLILKREDNTKIKEFYYQYIGKPVLPIIMVLNLKK